MIIYIKTLINLRPYIIGPYKLLNFVDFRIQNNLANHFIIEIKLIEKLNSILIVFTMASSLVIFL